MDERKNASIMICCTIADISALEKVSTFAETCQKAWEELFGEDSRIYFNIDMMDEV